ncbi:MAG: UDP-N-acetyl glucosamine 2-epimerase [Chloroflexota bacterium]|nr:UDP-N-acetyl glucosamine 2-epimerase [Chloroflexota bacterium]
MKLLTVVGARPQFIKAAAFSRVARRRHTEVLVHTGQHYDAAMSDVFFDELGLPRPDHHLGVGSGPHGRQTARMLERLEDVMRREAPDAVVVYGDTNSTLAGALAAAKLGIPVAHVEAGLRSFVRDMPEEVNRIVADSVSAYLFAPTQTAVDNLLREGHALTVPSLDAPPPPSTLHPPSAGAAGGRIYLTGDIMYDALLSHAPLAATHSRVLDELALRPGGYALATVHRAANTDDAARLERIVDALAMLREPVVLPVHPRTRAALAHTDIEVDAAVRVIDPVGYLDMLALQQHARIVLTDSGGVQKEAYLLGVPCVTLRDETEWVETLAGGWNVLAGADPERILAAARRARPAGEPPPVFGDGHAAERMVEALESA